MVIARIPDNVSDASLRTIETAHRAETAGWQNVSTGWDPQKQDYTVSGDEPDQRPGGGR